MADVLQQAGEHLDAPEVLRCAPRPKTANGFTASSKVEESIDMGTLIVFNFDSIRERRLLTSDFDSQYGNCSGGHIIAVPKSNDNRFHDEGFRLLGKTKLGARNFFCRAGQYLARTSSGA